MTEEKDRWQFKAIGHVHSDFPEKFGLPRQSGLVEQLEAFIVMEPEFRDREAFRGLEGCSHIWLIWEFSETSKAAWSPTVRPPRLGGERRMGVFATRSPFRPNPIGLSSVKLERIEFTHDKGPVLHISGADLMDGTPILDIKPYLAYTDSHPDAKVEYLEGAEVIQADSRLEVDIPPKLETLVPPEKRSALRSVLSLDPRPRFHNDSNRIYGMSFCGLNIQFKASNPADADDAKTDDRNANDAGDRKADASNANDAADRKTKAGTVSVISIEPMHQSN
ncbi:MAG: tRNA (N6-threonylcarbamoyladenosine(37)-N6)-methyltransferase TrmO [Sphaerochaetaceae bacterium]